MITGNGDPTQARDCRSQPQGVDRFLTAVIRTRPQSDREAFEKATLSEHPSETRGNRVVHKGRPGGDIVPESSGKTNLCQRGDGFLSLGFEFIVQYQLVEF
jgi:hypothetical protein